MTVVDQPAQTPAARSAQSSAWTDIRPATGLLRGLSFREVVAYRAVAVALAQRRLKARYKQTATGALWVVFQPLVTVVVFTLVFGDLAGLPSGGIPYPVFVLSGLVLWNFHAASLQGAADSLVEHHELVTKIYFPRLLAPAAAVIPPLVDLAVGLSVLAVAMLLYGVAPGLAVLSIPLWINVQYRDVGYGLPFLVQLWLFVTPIIFASSSVDGPLRVVLALNPVTGIVDGFRWAAIGAPAPPAVDLLSLATGVAAVAASLVYFQRVERRFADVV
jgi:lipopolysaccharide transport system permease protein